MIDIQHLMLESLVIATEHGFTDHEIYKGFARVMGEVAEAVEELDKGHDPCHVYLENKKPMGVPIEMADVIIRLCTLAQAHGIDLENAISVKQRYNEGRSFRHGGKRP